MTWPSVQNDEESSFQQQKGIAMLEEDALDFPHNLKIGLECHKAKKF